MYKVDPPGPGDHLAMHLAIDGWALFREGDEAKLQVSRSKAREVGEGGSTIVNILGMLAGLSKSALPLIITHLTTLPTAQ